MFNPVHSILLLAAAIGLAIGLERAWRGFGGSALLHAAPALLGAFLVIRQPGLIALFWFLPLQILLWLIVTATVCMWSAERTPDGEGQFRGAGGLALSWSLAFLLGASCAFGAWLLVGSASVALIAFGLRTPRRVQAVQAAAAPASAHAQPVEQGGAGETVGGADAAGDLEGVDGQPGGAAEPAVDRAAIMARGEEPLLHLPAA